MQSYFVFTSAGGSLFTDSRLTLLVFVFADSSRSLLLNPCIALHFDIHFFINQFVCISAITMQGFMFATCMSSVSSIVKEMIIKIIVWHFTLVFVSVDNMRAYLDVIVSFVFTVYNVLVPYTTDLTLARV